MHIDTMSYCTHGIHYARKINKIKCTTKLKKKKGDKNSEDTHRNTLIYKSKGIWWWHYWGTLIKDSNQAQVVIVKISENLLINFTKEKKNIQQK